jgi:hypothetical protein
MAVFQVELDGKVVKTFEAERFIRRDDAFWFKDQNDVTIGAIIVSPGMSVTKAGHDGSKQQGR